jgi:hypothetical protein
MRTNKKQTLTQMDFDDGTNLRKGGSLGVVPQNRTLVDKNSIYFIQTVNPLSRVQIILSYFFYSL